MNRTLTQNDRERLLQLLDRDEVLPGEGRRVELRHAPPETLADYLDMPVDRADAILAQYGLAPLDSAVDIMAAVDRAADEALAERAATGEPTEDFPEMAPARPSNVRHQPLEPAGFAQRLFLKLNDRDRIVIHGAAGSGKTYFLKHLFAASEDVRRTYPRVMHVDCTALGMRDASQMSREMIWGQFGLDDEGYFAFNTQHAPAQGGLPRAARAQVEDPIRAYLNYRFDEQPGLVVLDHTDRLASDGAISNFLSKSLLPAARELGLKVVFCQRAKPDQRQRRTLMIDEIVAFPAYTETEVQDWLSRTFGQDIGISARQLLDAIGARPELLDTFRAFAKQAWTLDGVALDEFVLHRQRWGHVPDCDRFIRAARHCPKLMSALFQKRGALDSNAFNQASHTCRRQLLLSGAIKVSDDGDGERSVAYASRMHEERMKTLFGTDAGVTLMLRGNETEMLEDGAWSYIKRYRELSADAIAAMIAAEDEPAESIRRFIKLLKRWGIDAEPFVRDPVISRLWAPFDNMDALDVFQPRLQPEFARTIQTGASVKCDDGRWFVPVRGQSGFISMVMRVTFGTGASEWSEKADIHALECLIDGVQITLAQILHRLVFEFERKAMAKRAILAREEALGHNGLLNSMGCSGWAVLERDDTVSRWFASRAETTSPAMSKARLVQYFTHVDTVRLDEYAQHRSRHGLVISGMALGCAFPALRNLTDAVFIQPLGRSGDCDRIVVFVFDLVRESGISGMKQRQLGAIASNLAA